jgi:preprotein translocase subunit SecA
LDRIRDAVSKTLSQVQVQSAQEVQEAEQVLDDRLHHGVDNVQYQHVSAVEGEVEAQDDDASMGAVPRTVSDKVGRNDPCPCGSGKKYKHCHGKLY